MIVCENNDCLRKVLIITMVGGVKMLNNYPSDTYRRIDHCVWVLRHYSEKCMELSLINILYEHKAYVL